MEKHVKLYTAAGRERLPYKYKMASVPYEGQTEETPDLLRLPMEDGEEREVFEGHESFGMPLGCKACGMMQPFTFIPVVQTGEEWGVEE